MYALKLETHLELIEIAPITKTYILQERLIDMQAKSGLIYHRVHYLKYKKPVRLGKKTKSNQLENVDADDVHTDAQLDSAIDEVAFLLFFKTCIVERDLDELKKRLELSIDMRQNLINKKGTEFHKVFPFYFVEPSLVSRFSNEWLKLFRSWTTESNVFFIFRFVSISKFATKKLTRMDYSTSGQQ